MLIVNETTNYLVINENRLDENTFGKIEDMLYVNEHRLVDYEFNKYLDEEFNGDYEWLQSTRSEANPTLDSLKKVCEEYLLEADRDLNEITEVQVLIKKI